MDQYLF